MIQPCKNLENAIIVINKVMHMSGNEYWLCFGGLWGLIMNQGTIPDNDLDICVMYGADYKKISAAFNRLPGGYTMGHAMISDDTGEAIHCGFSSSNGLPHICLSFWINRQGYLWYGHDQYFEVQGVGIPKSGYFLKGMPASAMNRGVRMVEWPGINQMTKVSVPRQPGMVLDYLYPGWAYRKQRYNVQRNEVQPDKLVSIYKGGAMSPYQIRATSIKDLDDERIVSEEISKSQREYEAKLKQGG